MTQYIDLITLEQAKLHLRIDDSQTETDAEITQMINSALMYIEKRTGWIVKDKTQTYYGNPYAVVFDYPITTILPEGSYERATNTVVPTVDGKVVLGTGIIDKDQYPTNLIDCALSLIDFWFYNTETRNSENTIPDFIVDNININRRFI